MTSILRAWCLLCLVCLLPSSLWAQRNLTNIPVPDPDEELRSFTVADGFEVNLFAADPLIHKPIQINFDPQGRLWVAASEVYPQIAPGQVANDKILILEDTTGDGVADKTTVFADGLLIPTGVVPGDGGVYVANSTELLHLSDTTGDGKADRSRIVLSGFGTEDTHHIIHTFRWGPEGLFYMNQSIYIHSHVETPFGVKRLNAGGIWQFRPETLQLNVFARGWINAWGHAFDRWGQSFVTDGAGGEGINFLVPGASYPTAFGAAEVLHGLNPGSPKYCGLAIVDGRHLPDDWQGNLITHDFRGHRVCRFVVEDSGSGFVSRQQPDLISSRHVAFRPIDVQQGPDGAIYIADWYNPIIQHGEVDFRDPRRDHVHGRIWRVTAKGRPLVEKPQLVDATVPQLLESLTSPESFTRQQAKRVLKERGAAAVVPQLQTWVAGLDASSAETSHQLLEALWVYQALDVVEPQLLRRLLTSDEPRARAAAVRVWTHWSDRLENPVEWLAAAVQDEFPRVRLEAVRALSTIPSVRAAELALAVTDAPLDGFLDYATRQTARELKPVWLPAVMAGQFQTDGKLSRLLFAMQAAQATEVVPQLVANLQQGKVAVENRPRVLEIVGSLGAPEHLRLVFDRALDESTPEAEVLDLLRALRGAQVRRNVRPAGELQPFVNLTRNRTQEVAVLAIDCLGGWKETAAVPDLQALATSADSADNLRRAAITALATIDTPATRETLKSLGTADVPEPISAAALAALATAEPAQTANSVIEWLRRSQRPDQQQLVLQAYLQKQGSPDLLAAALQGQTLPADVAKIALRAVTSSGRPETKLTEALTQAGGITNQAVELNPAEMTEMLAAVREFGDAARGEAIYRRKELSCQKCHAIGGAGGKVGPDLISIGASAQPDYLVDALLAPSKHIKEGYQTLVAVLEDGKVVTGVKVRETDTALILRNVDDQEVAIPLQEIDEVVNGLSLMPVGLTDKLTKGELLDLTRFLTELGKPGGAFAVNPTLPVARHWQVLEPDDASYRRLYRTSDAQLMADDTDLNWQPAFSTVAGLLPVSDLPEFRTKIGLTGATRRVVFVRTWLESTSEEPITLRWNDTTGLQMWLDRQPQEIDAQKTFRLPVGRHLVSVSIDRAERETPLRLDIQGDAAFQPIP